MTSQASAPAYKRPAPWTVFDYVKLMMIGFLLIPAAQRLTRDDYAFIRYMATAMGAYGSYLAARKKRWGWLAGFAFIVVAFNPLFRVSGLGREVWIAIDLFAAVFLALSLRESF